MINSTDTYKKGVIRIVIATALILAAPLIAMQFSEEVDWGLLDFIIIGTLLLCSGLVYEFAVKRLRTRAKQMIAAAVLLVVVLLIWAELAVGIFGSPFAGS